MKLRHIGVGAFSALAFSTIVSVAAASSHREAPAISQDPAADNTDLWAWMNGARDRVYIVAAYNPLEEPAGGPNFNNFSPDVLYEVHFSRGATSLNDAVRYEIRFSQSKFTQQNPAQLDAGLIGGKEFFYQISGQTNTYSVTKVVGNVRTVLVTGAPVAPANIGPRTNAVVYGAVAADAGYDPYSVSTGASGFVKAMAGNVGFTWAGPRDDGFYVDLGGIFDLANLRAAGTAQDGVAGYNCHAIALEINSSELTATGGNPLTGVDGAAATNDPQTLGVWASASRRKVSVLRKNGATETFGPWTQVSRLGLPLINEAVIGLQDKDKYNRTHPKDDVANFGAYFLNPVIVRDAIAVGILPPNTTMVSNRTDILDIIGLKNIGSTIGGASVNSHNITAIGDVLRLDMGFASSFPNGRPLPANVNTENDVTDILLSVLLTGAPSGVSDGVNYNDKNYLATIPWLAGPWQGYAEGHGIPTP